MKLHGHSLARAQDFRRASEWWALTCARACVCMWRLTCESVCVRARVELIAACKRVQARRRACVRVCVRKREKKRKGGFACMARARGGEPRCSTVKAASWAQAKSRRTRQTLRARVNLASVQKSSGARVARMQIQQCLNTYKRPHLHASMRA
eukprot:6209271-Pleurochrysis_carterae.AAC.2